MEFDQPQKLEDEEKLVKKKLRKSEKEVKKQGENLEKSVAIGLET